MTKQEAYNAWQAAEQAYDDAVEKYHEIENKIYAAGTLSNYYSTIQTDLEYAVNSFTSSSSYLDGKFVFAEIEDANSEILEYKEKCNSFSTTASDIQSKLSQLVTKLNEKLENQHKLIIKLNTEKINACNKYMDMTYEG